MRVKIGNVDFPDVIVKRFIDLQSGLPLSMIQVNYTGNIDTKEIGTAMQKQALLPFECGTLKTNVLVHGASHDSRTNKHEYILQERAADVSSSYKLMDWTQPTKDKNMIFIVPETLADGVSPEELKKLPYIHFILKKNIPQNLFKKS